MEDPGSERPVLMVSTVLMVATELMVALETVIAPLVEADGGELYILPADSKADPKVIGPLRLHLGGRFAGCPGNSLVGEHIIRPALEPLAPSRSIEISSGRLVPPGAERIAPLPRKTS